MSIYFNNSWKPVPYSIIKDRKIAEMIESKGFAIETTLSSTKIEKLTQLFKENHEIDNKEGGMFYSIYSQNIAYRNHIHNAIGKILQPILETYFEHYKMVLNSFVVKAPGPKSEFYLHQDTTGLDEWKHSPLSLWIPLHDVDESNGCLGVIPYSQHFFSPYRSISFPAPFDTIQNMVKQYLQPIEMKVGEMLLFDNRMLHHSYANHGVQARVAVICGLFPKDAKMVTCHKPEYKCGGEVELLEHEDDFLLTGKNFLVDCQKRPETGKSLGWVEDPYSEICVEEFVALCQKYGLKKTSDKVFEHTDCEMIGEPVFNVIGKHQSIGLLNKLKQLVSLK
jgi:hypothetical protein